MDGIEGFGLYAASFVFSFFAVAIYTALSTPNAQ
jgi:hypothetical protein